MSWSSIDTHDEGVWMVIVERQWFASVGAALFDVVDFKDVLPEEVSKGDTIQVMYSFKG